MFWNLSFWSVICLIPSTITTASWLLSSFLHDLSTFFFHSEDHLSVTERGMLSCPEKSVVLSQTSLIGEHGCVSMGGWAWAGQHGWVSMGEWAWAGEPGYVSIGLFVGIGGWTWVSDISVFKIVTAYLKILLCWSLCWSFKGINSQGRIWIWLSNHNYRHGF